MITAISRNKTESNWLRKYRVWMHIAFWGLYYGFLLMYFWNIDMIGNSFHLENHTQVFQLCGILLFISIYLHYGTVYVVIPVYRKSISLGILLTLLYVFSTYWLSHFLFTKLLYVHNDMRIHNYYYSRNLFSISNAFFFFNVTIYLTFTSITLKLALSQYTASKKTLLLSQLRNDIEVEFLKSQIKPHFLFNALNSIYGIALNDQQAIDLLLDFSKLLRYLLYNSDDNVTLEEEINIIRIFSQINHKINPGLHLSFEFDKIDNRTIRKYDLFTQVQHIFQSPSKEAYTLIEENDTLYFR